MSEQAKGRFVWYDLMTTDPDGAGSFYSQVIGWGTAPWDGPSEEPYTLWMNGESPLGGLMKLPQEAVNQGAPPHWLAYIATPDVDATTARAQELGARVHVPPTDIPTVGRFAVMADPQGATFAVFTPAGEAPGKDGTPEAGDMSWHELMTSDYEGAFDFYSELFGWQKTEAMDMGEMGIYQMYGQEGSTYGGMMNKPAEIPAPPHWLFYTTTGDLDGAVEKVKELGGQLLHGPMEVPGGDRVAQFMDPQGAAFALHEFAKEA